MKSKIQNPAFVLFIVLFLSAATFAQTTEFTYQGSLKDGGNTANGSYDFEFAVFDSLSAGSQVGATLTRNGVMVTNGIFSVKLDFGSQFSGASRYLEIRVRPSGQPGITILDPRQFIDSSPYSVRSLNSGVADSATTAANATQLGGVAASQYVLTGDARLSDARNPLPGSANYIQNTMSPQANSTFSISGNGTMGGAVIASSAQITNTASANIINAITQFNLGGNRVFSAPGTFNLFVGQNVGTANTGTLNSFVGTFAGQNNTTGGSNSFFGLDAGNANTSGTSNSFVGVTAGGHNSMGNNNSFLGTSAGDSNTTESGNSFFGENTGFTNTTGSSNTLIGDSADVGGANLNHATAIGANAVVGTSSTVQLGRADGSDTVDVPGKLQIDTLGTAGGTPLCLNGANRVGTCAAAVRADKTAELQARIEAQQKEIELQSKQIDTLTKIVCSMKAEADICSKIAK